MKIPFITLLAGVCASLIALSAPATGQDMRHKADAKAGQSDNGAKASVADAGDPMLGAVLVVLPAVQASDDQLGNGCWVRFYDDRNYQGSNLTLVGPVYMPNMSVPGAAWRDWDSAMVGPKARVSTFDNVDFSDRTASLAPGQHIPDLRDKKLGWFDEIHSARVTCTG